MIKYYKAIYKITAVNFFNTWTVVKSKIIYLAASSWNINFFKIFTAIKSLVFNAN